jgi:NAD(P)-dependent dehydrogenase (short-subunit alcohol dehydrogenase family)
MGNSQKKLLLLGGTRGLGAELKSAFDPAEYEVIAAGSSTCDVSGDYGVEQFFSTYHPDVLIYLSVYNEDSLVHKLSLLGAERQVQTNALGFLRVLRSVLPPMREKKFGKIVFLSSILATHPIRGAAIYSSCKAFGETVIRTVALENAKYGITANALQLGYFNIGLMEKIPPALQKDIVESIPLKRLGEIQEVAQALHFILGNEYLTGSVVKLAGGLEAI